MTEGGEGLLSIRDQVASFPREFLNPLLLCNQLQAYFRREVGLLPFLMGEEIADLTVCVPDMEGNVH